MHTSTQINKESKVSLQPKWDIITNHRVLHSVKITAARKPLGNTLSGGRILMYLANIPGSLPLDTW